MKHITLNTNVISIKKWKNKSIVVKVFKPVRLSRYDKLILEMMQFYYLLILYKKHKSLTNINNKPSSLLMWFSRKEYISMQLLVYRWYTQTCAWYQLSKIFVLLTYRKISIFKFQLPLTKSPFPQDFSILMTNQAVTLYFHQAMSAQVSWQPYAAVALTSWSTRWEGTC